MIDACRIRYEAAVPQWKRTTKYEDEPEEPIPTIFDSFESALEA
ncbi:MAG TPA: hypothetical protein VN729_12115 [Ktedonobacteraceae bacterium]|nr:hypothetical protein [Ktedonobacteraceae bacterium]